MKDRWVLVYGGRDFRPENVAECRQWLVDQLRGFGATGVLHGGARGADTFGGQVAMATELDVLVRMAKWSSSRPPQAAGVRRNARMLHDMPVGAVEFPGGRGTADMQRRVLAAHIPLVKWSDR